MLPYIQSIFIIVIIITQCNIFGVYMFKVIGLNLKFKDSTLSFFYFISANFYMFGNVVIFAVFKRFKQIHSFTFLITLSCISMLVIIISYFGLPFLFLITLIDLIAFSIFDETSAVNMCKIIYFAFPVGIAFSNVSNYFIFNEENYWTIFVVFLFIDVIALVFSWN